MSFENPDESGLGNEPQRSRWLFPILVAVMSVVLGGGLYFVWRANAVSRVVATSGRLTLGQDVGGNLTEIDPRTKPELWYHVTLDHTPVGDTLPLTCEWTDPQGQLVKQNRYETKVIDRAVWPTHARCQFGGDSPRGTWRVQLLLKGRPLHALSFDVRDGMAEQK